MKRLVVAALAALLMACVAHAAETYRLIQAIGDEEREAARDLSEGDCEMRKQELKRTAEILGTYNERTGLGSITCLPESAFED